MDKIGTIELDHARHVFGVHGVDDQGYATMRQKVEDRMRVSHAISERHRSRLFDQALAPRTLSEPAVKPTASGTSPRAASHQASAVQP
jgi:hypothetical protein